MAQVAHRKPKFVSALVDALTEKLPGASVQTERILGLNRSHHHRILVVSDRFEEMDLMARNDLVWDVARKVLSDDQLLRISMIVTLTPQELEGE